MENSKFAIKIDVHARITSFDEYTCTDYRKVKPVGDNRVLRTNIDLRHAKVRSALQLSFSLLLLWLCMS